MNVLNFLKEFIDWSNENSGFVSVIIFLATILIAQTAGVFKFFRNNPKFKIEIINQCSFGCSFDLGETYKEYPVNKTAFSIYLRVSNVGRADSSIGRIELGYLKSDFYPSFLSKRVWLKETISKEDFKVNYQESEKVKIYPFLKQRNSSFPYYANDTFLQIGKEVNGIVYFEQPEAYGSYLPRVKDDEKLTSLKIKIKDTFGHTHSKRFKLKMITPKEAMTFNSLFGQTHKEYFESNK